MISRRGFTLIELMIAIAVIGILLVLGTISLRGIQGQARDKERESDAQSIVTYLESIYPREFSIGGTVIKSAGSYPSTVVLTNPTYYKVVFDGLLDSAVKAPGSTAPGFVPATHPATGITVANVRPLPTIDTYIYTPVESVGGDLCTTVTAECRSFQLYYRTEAGTNHTVEAKRG